MSFTQLTTNLSNHQSLPDRPNANDGLTASEVKELYDKAANDIKDYINNTLIPELPINLVTKTELTTTRKLSASGDFTGTLNGQPITSTDPGLSSAFNALVAETVTQIFNVKTGYSALGDGVTDDTAAIQAAVNAASLVKGTVFFPYGIYLTTAPINITGNANINVFGMGGITYSSIIKPNFNGDAFNVSADFNIVFKDLRIQHMGASGSCIRSTGEGHRIESCAFENVIGNASDMVYFNGANTHIYNCNFNNKEATSFCINCQSTDAKLNINSYIDTNYFAAEGKGVRVSSNDVNNRPEGLKIVNNTMILTGGEHIKLETVFHVDISNNMLDQGGNNSISFNPTGEGIDGVYIASNYISTVSGGTGIYSPSITADSVKNVSISDNMVAFSSYGILLNSGNSYFAISNNHLIAISQTGITVDKAIQVVITGNPHVSGTTSIVITDGDSGGSYVVKDNVFLGPIVLNRTDKNKFVIKDNVGYKSSNSVTNTFSVTVAGTVYVNVIHGLAATPDIKKILVSVYQNATGAEFGGWWIISADATTISLAVRVTTVGIGSAQINAYAEL